MQVFTLFPHIIVVFFCNNKLSSECADSCIFVSYSKVKLLLGCGGGGGGLILVDVENWLDNARMYNGYLKINKKKK